MRAAEIIVEVSPPNVIPPSNSTEFINSNNFMLNLMKAVPPIPGDVDAYTSALISAVIKRSSDNLNNEDLDKIINQIKTSEPDFLNPDKDPTQLQNDLIKLSPKITQAWYQGRKDAVFGKLTTDSTDVVDTNLEKLIGIHPRRGREFFVQLRKIINDPTRFDKFKKDINTLLTT
jgi:hypothetical protein